jgi:Zn-dependent protease
MRTSITFGYAAGIPLRIHYNWFITAGLVTWSLAAGYFPYQYPGWGTWTYWFLGMFTALLFFGSVLLHELGHSLVALKEGVEVNSITLFIFGGVAHIGREPETAGSEFRIVAAGPITSLSLAAAFFLAGTSGILGQHLSGAALYLGQMNVVLALFNLLPGFPLDGGRILRSALWKWTKDFSQSTRWATNAGIGVALIFVLAGIGLMAWGEFFSGGWIAFVGVYLGMAAKEGYRQVDLLDQEEQSPEDLDFLQGDLSERTRAASPLSVPVGMPKSRPWQGDMAYSSVFIMAKVVAPNPKHFLHTKKVKKCDRDPSRDSRDLDGRLDRME